MQQVIRKRNRYHINDHLISALSRISTRLVAASTTTPEVVLKPSISTRSWLRVFSASELENARPPRFRPTASISSMNRMQGAFWGGRERVIRDWQQKQWLVVTFEITRPGTQPGLSDCIGYWYWVYNILVYWVFPIHDDLRLWML